MSHWPNPSRPVTMGRVRNLVTMVTYNQTFSERPTALLKLCEAYGVTPVRDAKSIRNTYLPKLYPRPTIEHLILSVYEQTKDLKNMSVLYAQFAMIGIDLPDLPKTK